MVRKPEFIQKYESAATIVGAKCKRLELEEYDLKNGNERLIVEFISEEQRFSFFEVLR